MENLTPEEIQLFIKTVADHSNYDFSNYSTKSFTRRLEKIREDYNFPFPKLLEKISKKPQFTEEVVKKITVNTTEIFRNPEIWQTINKDIIPRYKDEENINIWHAAASTGQEAYTMLILLKQHNLYEKSRVYATDINSDVLKTAESGVYKHKDVNEYVHNFNETYKNTEIQPDINDYFKILRKRHTVKVKPFLLKKTQYRVHDLTKLTNPFEQKFHMIFCRNVLIYFNHELQDKIIQMFERSLVKGGTLVIGKHEDILGNVVNCFEKRGTIFIKK